MSMGAGQIGATQLLGSLLAHIPDPHDEGLSVGAMTTLPKGVAAEITLPTGDRYLIAIEWQGDRET